MLITHVSFDRFAWLCTVCLGMCLTSTGSAAPVIQQVSGTLNSGDSITITGLEFSSNAIEYEWLGDKIEAGSVDTDFAKARWNNDWGFNNAKYAIDQKHSGSKSLYCTATSTAWNCAFSYRLPNAVTSGQRIYATWWVRKSNSENSGQWKMIRLAGIDRLNDGPQSLVIFNWNPRANGGMKQIVIDPGTSNEETFWPPDVVFPWGDNSWYRVELDVKASGAGQTNGIATLSRYSGSSFDSYSTAPIITHHNSSDNYSHFIFQNYCGNGMDSCELWFDDVFIQPGSAARVELCDSPNWAARSHCEIQLPLTWSAGSITTKVNLGAFEIGQTAYLFVIDSQGSSSNGLAVSIGSTSTPLEAPTELDIVGTGQ